MWCATFDLWPDLSPTVRSSCLLPSVSSPTTSPSLLFSSLSSSQAKVDNEIIDYRDLAAIPRVKAIYDIEHPDMISYKCVNDNSSTLDNKGNRQEKQRPAEVTPCATVQAHIGGMFVCHCFDFLGMIQQTYHESLVLFRNWTITAAELQH